MTLKNGIESWLLCFDCLVTVNLLWILLTVPWVGLQCVIVFFPDHTHLLFCHFQKSIEDLIFPYNLELLCHHWVFLSSLLSSLSSY